MIIRLSLYLVLSSLLFGVAGASQTDDMAHLASTYNQFKSKAVELDKERRKVLASLYGVNKRIKKISERKEELTRQVLSARANSKDLAKEVVRLEKLIAQQKVQLGKRLKLLYQMSGKNSVRMLFNAMNSHDFDRNLKFLRLIAEHQYDFIKQYEQNVAVLNQQKEKFRSEVKELAGLQKKVKAQEKLLVADESKKKKLLDRYRQERASYVNALKGIRQKSKNIVKDGPFDTPEELKILRTAFFEKKGKLSAPVEGQVVQDYGLIYNDTYKYRLRHKGLFFAAAKGTEVKAVSWGKVVFSGEIPGYGKTVVLDHGDNYYTVYGHNDKISVSEGDTVDGGQKLGFSGGGSKQYGHGVYFEIRHFSDAVNPKAWLADTKSAPTQETTL